MARPEGQQRPARGRAPHRCDRTGRYSVGRLEGELALTRRNLTPGTFMCVPLTIAMDPDLGKPALRVAMLMAKFEQCWLSTQTMAAKLQMPRSSVIEGCAQLVARGHARRDSKPGRSSVYTLLFRALAELDFLASEAVQAIADDVAPSEPVCRPARPDRQNRSGGDRQNWSGEKVRPTGISDRPDQIQGTDLTGSAGHNLNRTEKVEREDDDEPAHAREASSSAVDTDMSDEGQALLIYDELAGRLAWPKAGHLTGKERKAMTARLRDAGGLNGWRVAMEKAEESNYLARTKPDLRFFLAEDKFAQLMRGRYDPEYDKRKRPSTISDMFKGIGMPWPSNNEEPQRMAEPEPEPARPPPPSQLTVNLWTIGRYANKSAAEMQALAEAWIQRLEAAGIDPATARQILSNAARMAPKSWSGLKRLEDRITRYVQKRQQP